MYIESAKNPAFYTFFEALGISKIYDNRIPQHSATKWNIFLRMIEASIISLKSANNRHISFCMLNRSKCKLWRVVGGRFSFTHGEAYRIILLIILCYFVLLTIITKSSILNVAAVLDPPLRFLSKQRFWALNNSYVILSYLQEWTLVFSKMKIYKDEKKRFLQCFLWCRSFNTM